LYEIRAAADPAGNTEKIPGWGNCGKTITEDPHYILSGMAEVQSPGKLFRLSEKIPDGPPGATYFSGEPYGQTGLKTRVRNRS
jgi:UDP-N-acetyl-D-mannosaminuronate dehydrogenase